MKILNRIRVITGLIMTVMVLVSVPKIGAKQIFYNSLDSQKSVKDGGGIVHAGVFVEGAFDNGFYSEKAGEAVHSLPRGNFY